MSQEVLAVTKCYDIVLWLLPAIEKFPRSHRFTLGQRIETQVLDLLSLLIEASYTKEKAALLRRSNLTLEIMRYLIRASKDLRILSERRYEFVFREMEILGKQIGGWARSVKGT